MKEYSEDNVDYETLGDNVVPSRYVLNFKPDMKTFKYDGTVEIDADVKKPTRSILLNASELEINSAAVYLNGHANGATVRYYKEKQRIGLELKAPVSGKISIRMAFTGINNDRMYGFYRSRYVHGKSERFLLTTQFEAANARNAFPCFDEPAFKATFDITLTVGKSMECVSNMPIRSTSALDGKTKAVRFEETPRMSTYLVYLGVGNYDSVEAMCGKTKVRVLTIPGRKPMARLPLEYAIKLIKFYEDYFGIAYPLPKVDLISIPDFAAGAMENWGAITFRETALLADEKTSLAGKQRVAEVIAHEIAHQWFGDLVTMRWWNDLWLNESFATFMASKADDHVFPEWNVKIEYLRDTIATAFAADQLKSTHPISVQVRSPSEIDQLFDEISYEKGGTVLNMMEHYAGETVFRDGLREYLRENSYSNATKYDLWKAVDRSAKGRGKSLDIYSVAKFWTDTPGYPIVQASRRGGSVSLSQSRYFLLKGSRDQSTWPIPINYSLQGKESTTLMAGKAARISAGKSPWIKINSGQNGLYRVSYDEPELSILGERIRKGQMPPADSWGIENDVFALARSGRTPVKGYLDFVESFCMDAKYPLSASILGHLNGLHNLLYYSPDKSVDRLALEYSNKLVDRLGWKVAKGEAPHDTLLRPSALMASAMLGNDSVGKIASEMFWSFVDKGSEIDTNIRGAVYRIVAWNEGKGVAHVLTKRYERESVPEEKIRLLAALAMFKDRGLLARSLEYSDSENVRLQDSYIIPAICSSNPVGRKIMLEWTEANWRSLLKRHASGTHMLGRYVDNLAGLDTNKDRAEVSRFFSAKANWRDDISHALANTLEMIEANTRFMGANASPSS